MFDKLRSKIAERIRKRGPTWRLSTWWPSDTRDAMQHSLLRILAIAHRERIDAAVLVDHLADEHVFGYRRRLRRLARRLASGTPLVAALEQTPDLLSDETVLAIRFASQTGTLPQTFQYLIDQRTTAANRAQEGLRQAIAFYGTTMLVTILVLSFLIIYIVPVFQSLIDDFGMSTPWAFGWFLSICQNLAYYAPLWILALIALAWLAWSRRSQRFFRRFVAARCYPPAAQLRSAELLDLLSIAVDAGRPLPSALSTLARYHFDTNVRRKLLLTRNEIEQGADVWNTLSETGLLTQQETCVLAVSSSNHTRAWLMRRLATWKRDKILRRHASAVSLFQPLLVLLLAGVVLFIGSAVFQFLANLIQTVA